jgi:glycosyltransferase involved in cell wall biosynthesis
MRARLSFTSRTATSAHDCAACSFRAVKILVLTNMYPPHHLGGYELSCHDVMQRLSARGNEIMVLTTGMRIPGVADPPAERTNGVRRELAFYWEDHRLLSPSIKGRIRIERKNQASLRRALAEFRPDVVSVWNMGAMSFGLLTTIAEEDVPMLFCVCDEWMVYGPRLDAWSRLFARRPRLARAARAVLRIPTGPPDLGSTGAFCFVSNYIRRISAEGSPWHPARVTTVYSGIDPGDFSLARASGRPWRWKLLCAGRLDERKGIHVAVRALAKLPGEATLDILGSGDAIYRARLEALVRELGLEHRVRFDVVPRAELHGRYDDADVVLFPVTWDEPFGLVPVEAMARGTPVVATGTGGSAEFLENELNCLLVSPGDDAALAAAVRRLAGDEALRARLTGYGFATASELTVDRLTDVLEAWHRSASERFAGSRPADRPPPLTVIREQI